MLLVTHAEGLRRVAAPLLACKPTHSAAVSEGEIPMSQAFLAQNYSLRTQLAAFRDTIPRGGASPGRARAFFFVLLRNKERKEPTTRPPGRRPNHTMRAFDRFENKPADRDARCKSRRGSRGRAALRALPRPPAAQHALRRSLLPRSVSSSRAQLPGRTKTISAPPPRA